MENMSKPFHHQSLWS